MLGACGRVSRLEENDAADEVRLPSEQVVRLSALRPAMGERYDDRGMAAIER